MKETLRIILPLLIIAAGIGGFFVLGLKQPMARQPDTGPKIPGVATVPVRAGADELDIETDGVVVPYREIQLAAEVAGRITKKAEVCRAGRFVRKGELLIEIDPRDYDLEVRRLNQELQQADVTIQELDVEVENTKNLIELADDKLELQKREMARLEKLDEKNFVTDSQLDLERQNELAARNALVTLRNQLGLLKTRRERLESAKEFTTLRIEKAKLDRQRTQITSPIDGMVVQDSVELDAYVNIGAPLVLIEDTSRVEVKCHLRMDQLYWILRQSISANNAAAEIDAMRGYQIPATPTTVVYQLGNRRYAWDGVLSRYDGIGLNETTRTVPCRVTVERPRAVRALGGGSVDASWAGPRALVRGMYVNLIIRAKPHQAFWEIPERALRPGNVVWRVRDGRLDIVEVRIVEVEEKMVLLDADGSKLVAGDRIVVSPLASVMDGMAVQEQARP